jgi:hypothetical protein
LVDDWQRCANKTTNLCEPHLMNTGWHRTDYQLPRNVKIFGISWFNKKQIKKNRISILRAAAVPDEDGT